MTHHLINQTKTCLCCALSLLSMYTDRHKACKHRLKADDILFRPIAPANDSTSYRCKSPSAFQTGLKYLKMIGQSKRSTENNSLLNIYQIKMTTLDRLERTSAFSTNYYAPVPSRSMGSVANKSIQAESVDDLSYKTAIANNYSYVSLYELLFSGITIALFISMILFIQWTSYPVHCLAHKKYWHQSDLSDGFSCESTSIEIHYVEIHSIVYQLEIRKNIKSTSCLGFDVLSCLPIDYFLVPHGQVIRRNDQLKKHCKNTRKMHCSNRSLSILPHEYKWNFKNHGDIEINHCACSISSKNDSTCFHFKISSQCNLQIPWFDYCLKHSKTSSSCQAYISRT